jgi:hypothetical protein
MEGIEEGRNLVISAPENKKKGFVTPYFYTSKYVFNYYIAAAYRLLTSSQLTTFQKALM